MKMILASGSPRRAALLAPYLPGGFEVVVPDVDETALPGEPPEELARRLALTKAQAVRALRPEARVIAGDTVVHVDGLVLGKPAENAEGAAFLRRLSGRAHAVTTGVALLGPDEERVFAVTTRVTFRALDEGEITWYVATGEGRDKAGGYAVQGLGMAFVTAVEGSLTNVVGLPVEHLREFL